jgi:hypothetical protein
VAVGGEGAVPVGSVEEVVVAGAEQDEVGRESSGGLHQVLKGSDDAQDVAVHA